MLMLRASENDVFQVKLTGRRLLTNNIGLIVASLFNSDATINMYPCAIARYALPTGKVYDRN